MNMVRNENETLEQYLNRGLAEYDKTLQEKENKKKNKRKRRARKRKGLILGLGLGALGLITAITGAFHLKKYNKYEDPKNKIEKVVDDKDLDDLGFDEENVENLNDAIYGNTTGDVDKNKVVEKDGTIWKDKEAADKSNQIGKEVIDDKNGALVVKPDGTVTEKDKDYVVKDETGKDKESGSNESGIPNGYAWDAELNKYVPKNEVGLYTYADATYYNANGKVVVNKGDKVSKKNLEEIKKTCTTTKPAEKTNTENNNTTNNNTQTTDEGKVNSNGTYTIYGTTYMDKATFQAFILDDNSSQNFGLYNGVIYPISVINEMNAQKTR